MAEIKGDKPAKKKRKKAHKPTKLDVDDFELLEENIGLKKTKRL
jgi:hypothetical protein